MKIRVKKNILLGSIQTVQNITTLKASLPILSNILIETQKDLLKVTATDLDVGISCVIPVDIYETGGITVPAKKFSEIIKELPGDDIEITVKKNNLVIIDAESCQFKIIGLSPEEFPALPSFQDMEAIKIEQSILKQMINLTSFVVSFNETRYVLSGTLFEIQKNNFRLVATDGKRLAVIEKKLKQDMDKNISFIVPIKTIQELNRNLKNEGELSLIINNNQIIFDLGGVVITSRLIEGEFPDYRQVIPNPSENKILVNREYFLSVVRRAALLSTFDYQAVKLEVFKNKLIVSKSTPDIGECREELCVEYQGKELVIGFNPVYFIDMLKNVPNEEVGIEITDSEKPAVIRIDGYVYIVLPMRLN